jgi:hypothetical protein
MAVRVHKTGGLAGVDDTLSVDPQGVWMRTARNASPRSGRLSAEQSARLRALSADPRLTAEAQRAATPTNCRDAFHYTVAVGLLTITYSDCPTDPDRPVAAVAIVEFLDQMAPAN